MVGAVNAAAEADQAWGPPLEVPVPMVVNYNHPEKGWLVRMMLPAADLALDFTKDEARELIADLEMALGVLEGKFGA